MRDLERKQILSNKYILAGFREIVKAEKIVFLLNMRMLDKCLKRVKYVGASWAQTVSRLLG